MVTKEELSKLEEELLTLSQEEQKKKLAEFIKSLPKEELEKLKARQCPFCLIASGQLKAYKIYESDSIIAVLDINPANPGHTIIFPKQHIASIQSLSNNQLLEIFQVAKQAIKKLEESLKTQSFNLLISQGHLAGQVIDHFLLHVIPRFQNDGLEFKWTPKKISEQELEKLAKILKIEKEIKESKPKEPKPKKPSYSLEEPIP